MPLSNVNLMGPNPAQPFDIQTEQARLAQLQQIAQQLIAQSMQGHSPVIRTAAGNQFGRDVPNFGDPIADIAQAMIGNKQLGQVQGQQANLAKALQERTAQDTGDYLSTRMGAPAQGGMGPPTPEGEAPAGIPARPGNFVEAVRGALASSVPAVRAMAAKDVADLPSPNDMLKYGHNFDPKAMEEFQRTLNPAALKGRGQVKIENGVAVPVQDETVLPTKAVNTFAPPIKDVATGLPGQTMTETGKFNALTGGNVTPPNVRENKLSEADVKQLEEGRKDYFSQLNTLSTLGQIRADMTGVDPAKFGTLAEFRMAANRAAELLGGKKAPDNASMETIHANLGNVMIEKIRALAPVTEEDVKMMKGIVGSEGNTKRALERIVEMGEASIARKLHVHRQFVENFAQQPGVDAGMVQRYAPDFNIQSRDPMSAGANPYSAMSDDEIRAAIKKSRGGK